MGSPLSSFFSFSFAFFSSPCEPAAGLHTCLLCSVVLSDKYIFIFCKVKSSRENSLSYQMARRADWLSQELVT